MISLPLNNTRCKNNCVCDVTIDRQIGIEWVIDIHVQTHNMYPNHKGSDSAIAACVWYWEERERERKDRSEEDKKKISTLYTALVHSKRSFFLVRRWTTKKERKKIQSYQNIPIKSVRWCESCLYVKYEKRLGYRNKQNT